MTTPYPTPWPANFQGCTFTGKFVYLDGTPVAGGGISLVPTPVAILDHDAATVIVPKGLAVTLSPQGQIKGWDGSTGAGGVVVPSTDDPDGNPIDWTYTVSENWPGGRKGYSMDAPMGGTRDLCNDGPVPSSGGQPMYRGPAGIPLGTVAAPATAASPGEAGMMAYDASYLYVCIATDTWKRVAVTTW